METLEELKEKYNNLNKERNILYNKIVKLEQQELNNKFKVGECWFNPYCDSFKKIIAIDKETLYCIIVIAVNEDSIRRERHNLEDIKYWRKITSEQFKDTYLAVMKDIQNPDLEDEKVSNWDVALKSVVESINNKK